MDATEDRYAYRCLPLTMANSMGWELLMPFGIAAEWNGGNDLDDVRVASLNGEDVGEFASAHFGSGVLTFSVGYLFRTEPATGLWVRGLPNYFKDGIAPLDGIVETDWLSFTFTMNWIFTRPGRIVFEAGEPFCFITPVSYRALETFEPRVLPIEDNPELAAEFADHSQLRRDFNRRLVEEDPDTIRQAWQKWYFRGVTPDGERRNPLHLSKLRAPNPVILAQAPMDKPPGDI
jgi:hypothetical protein